MAQQKKCSRCTPETESSKPTDATVIPGQELRGQISAFKMVGTTYSLSLLSITETLANQCYLNSLSALFHEFTLIRGCLMMSNVVQCSCSWNVSYDHTHSLLSEQWSIDMVMHAFHQTVTFWLPASTTQEKCNELTVVAALSRSSCHRFQTRWVTDTDSTLYVIGAQVHCWKTRV